MRVLPVSLGRSFNGLWFGTGAANLGDGMVLFALPLLALASGASPGGVAAVTTALTLAWPVFGLHAGWIVDRVDRRSLLGGVNLVRALVLTGLTAGHLAGALSLPVILVAAALLGVAETLADTALTSTVPMLVGPAGRNRANARIEATVNVTNQLAGPPLAGLLAGLTLALTTGTGTVLYLLAIAGLAMTALPRIPAETAMTTPRRTPTEATATTLPRTRTETTATTTRRTPAETRSAGGGEVVAGFRFLWRQPVVRTLTLFTAAMNVVWAVPTALMVVHAVGPGPLGLTAAQYGLLMTAMAVGGLLASAVAEPLRRRFGVTTLLVADAVGTVLLVAPVALGANAWLVSAGMVIAGAGSSVWRILVATLRQNLTPPDLLGRVYAASRVLSWGVIPAGAALAGVGAEVWDVRTVFAVATGLALVTLAAFVPFALRTDLSAAVQQAAGHR
ncbi:MFS transporter [Streptosporangium sp. NPDC002721]|uniref:MFS transporter n=1 Tax=Streptosporangium sp. NPDC002721 TaxID=3366188 RepID=UPI00368F2D8A